MRQGFAFLIPILLCVSCDIGSVQAAEARSTLSANRELLLTGTSCVSNGNTVFVYNGGWIYSSAPTAILCTLPLHVGDVIREVSFKFLGNYLVDSLSAVSRTSGASTINLNPGGAMVTSTDVPGMLDVAIDVVDTTLTANDSIVLQTNPNAAGLFLGQIRVLYDSP